MVPSDLSDVKFPPLKTFFLRKERKSRTVFYRSPYDIGKTVAAGVKTSDINILALVRTLAWLS